MTAADLIQSFRPLFSLAAGILLTCIVWSLDRHFNARRRPDAQGWTHITPGFASWLCLLLCAAVVLCLAFVIDGNLLQVGERPRGLHAAWAMLVLFSAGFGLTAAHIFVGLRARISWRAREIRFRVPGQGMQHRQIGDIVAGWSRWNGSVHLLFEGGQRISFSPYDSGAGRLMIAMSWPE